MRQSNGAWIVTFSIVQRTVISDLRRPRCDLASIRRVAWFVLFASLIGLLASSPVLSHETAKVNTEDAPPVDPGVVETEFTYSYGFANRRYDASGGLNDRRKADEHAFSFKLSYGLIDDVDVAATMSYIDFLDRETEPTEGEGFGDLSILAKWRFLSLYEKFDVAYVPGFTAPIGEQATTSSLGPSQEFWSVDQLLALTFASDPYHVSFDTGYFVLVGEKRGDYRGLFVSDIAFGYQLTRWLQPEIELNYGHAFFSQSSDAERVAITLGAIVNLPLQNSVVQGVRLDLGIQHAVLGQNVDQAMLVVANLSLSF